MVVVPLSTPAYDVPVLGPIGVAVTTLTTTWAQVIGADPMRRGIIFSNPGDTYSKFVAPANLSAQPATLEGALRIYPQEDLIIFAENEHENINAAWRAWTENNADAALSIMNFTGANQSVPAPMPLASLAQGSSISSPNGSGVLVTTTSRAAIGANAQRRGIALHNAGSVALAFCPANLAAVFGGGSVILLPGQTKTYQAKPQSRIRVNTGFNVIAQSGSNNPLTILEFLG